MKKTLLFLLLSSMLLGLLTACGDKKPESISITLNGEPIQSLDIVNGTEISGICAVVTPEDSAYEISWESDDFGVVKVSSSEGNICSVAAKKTGSAKLTAKCGEVSTFIRVHVLKNQEMLSERDTALTVHGKAYSSEVCTLYFAGQYYDFAATYADYAAYYGLDLSTGMAGLKDQESDYSSDGTWYGYFLESALMQISQVQALCDYAGSIGLTLDESEMEDIGSNIDELVDRATEQGFENADSYLAVYYGKGITLDMYRTFLEENALANKAFESYAGSLSFSEEEITGHYKELGYEKNENNYHVTSMRHILVLAEPDENGTYSDESIAAAHKKAEEFYSEWCAGEKTEGSFAELAETYSDDQGSAATGGLYEDIYQGQMVDGINDWLFAKNRVAGDTAIIDNNGSYVGTHIVYFVGQGDLYSNVLALEDLRDTALSEWFAALTADYSAEAGADYASIGVA